MSPQESTRESQAHKCHSLLTKNISRVSMTSSSTSRSATTIVAGIVGPRRSSAPRRNDNNSITVTRAAGAADKLSGIVFEPFNEVRKSLFFFYFPFKAYARLTRGSSFLSRPLSLNPSQVKPELANVSKLAGDADVSLARAGFTSDCEAALNEQIK